MVAQAVIVQTTVEETASPTTDDTVVVVVEEEEVTDMTAKLVNHVLLTAVATIKT